ncbi:MAG: cytochrome c-type biogenesis protein CcmF [Paraglaciecola sp.]|jgi:cytochrome c-type biogenesis protein CcmF
MEEIQYIGEHLLPGQIGKFAVVLGFVGALFASIAYAFATNRRDTNEFASWHKLGRIGFTLHGLAVFTIIGTMFYMMANTYFEYQYVQLHVSEDLPKRYILSAFWEGQEGSFLLWMFWHAILGFVLMWRGKQWEAPVLAVLALVEVFLMSMIMGVYIGDMKFGSNPFLLLRDVMDIPLFNNADYVSLIKGNGLNPLLQNYWMTIHPPTLFLGFASTVVPFCFAVAGLWTNQHKAWLKPALPWALFSGAILGTGILMGGAWAYEALSFGGYWAWDPVENASLVPWIILVAGIHTNLIAKNTGFSIKSTYLFYILTFFMILYSTFLTRSGILGETSVHAFTEMGLENQLVALLVVFLLVGLVPLFFKRKAIPSPKKEEKTASREFWMFIGTLVLVFSAAMITASTSLPIYNKIYQIFDPSFEGLTINDPIEHYNKYQLWIGVFIAMLSAFTQFLRYRGTNWEGKKKSFWKHIGGSVIISVALTLLTKMWIDANAWQYVLLLFTGILSVVANLDYLIMIAKGNMKMAAGTFAHIGFGLMLVGVLASGLNKEYISTNKVAQRGLLEEEMLEKNVLLFKGMPMFMSGYEVTYERDTMIGNERTFQVNYKKLNTSGDVTEEFTVMPTATYDNKVTKVAAMNPDTKHYLHKDIFTHIATLPRKEYDFEFAHEQEDSLKYTTFNFDIDKPVIVKDTLIAGGKKVAVQTEVTLLQINKNGTHPDYIPVEGDIAVSAKFALSKVSPDTVFYAEPLIVIRQNLLYNYPIQMNDISLKIRLTEDIFDEVLTLESELDYSPFTMKKGDKITFNGQEIQFNGFNREPQHIDYEAEEGDIAVGGIFAVNNEYNVQPIYVIRENRPMSVKDEVRNLGLHFRFNSIDPATESIEVLVAKGEQKKGLIPVDIAKNSLRTDYIVLEAIIFPGINFFWLGSILMMVGLAIGMVVRRQERA